MGDNRAVSLHRLEYNKMHMYIKSRYGSSKLMHLNSLIEHSCNLMYINYCRMIQVKCRKMKSITCR